MILGCPSINTNFLSPNGFDLVIERLPNVSFFTQTVILPSVMLSIQEQLTPLSKMLIPGEQIDFSPLTIQFMVDSNMNNYHEVFKWIRGLGFPENHDQYKSENNRGFDSSSDLQNNYSDAKLLVYGPTGNTIRTFNFIDCFPISLDGVSFTTTNTDVPYAVASMTLSYSYFTIS